MPWIIEEKTINKPKDRWVRESDMLAVPEDLSLGGFDEKPTAIDIEAKRKELEATIGTDTGQKELFTIGGYSVTDDITPMLNSVSSWFKDPKPEKEKIAEAMVNSEYLGVPFETAYKWPDAIKKVITMSPERTEERDKYMNAIKHFNATGGEHNWIESLFRNIGIVPLGLMQAVGGIMFESGELSGKMNEEIGNKIINRGLNKFPDDDDKINALRLLSEKKEENLLANIGRNVYDYASEKTAELLPVAEPGTFKYWVNNATVSAINNLSWLASSIVLKRPAFGLVGMSVQAKAQAYPQYREKGLNPLEASLASTAIGGLEGVTELVPWRGYFKPHKSLVQMLLHQEFKEIPTEILNTIGQKVVDKIALDEDITLPNAIDAIVDTTIVTALATAPMAGGSYSINRAYMKQQTPEIKNEFFNLITEKVGEGKQRKEAFFESVDELKKTNPEFAEAYDEFQSELKDTAIDIDRSGELHPAITKIEPEQVEIKAPEQAELEAYGTLTQRIVEGIDIEGMTEEQIEEVLTPITEEEKAEIVPPQQPPQVEIGKAESPTAVAPKQKVYHGTSKETADNIREQGFTKPSGIGMSSQLNPEFTFVSSSLNVAKYYGKSNFRIKTPDIVEAEIEGKIYELKESLPDYRAFGKIADIFNAREKGETLYDYKKIKQVLMNNGYVGFSFKDSNAGNRISFAVIPESLKLIKTKPITKALKDLNDALGEKGDIGKGAMDIDRVNSALFDLGNAVYSEGKTTLKAFSDRIQGIVGKAWDTVKQFVNDVWNAVKAFNERLGEEGAIRISKAERDKLEGMGYTWEQITKLSQAEVNKLFPLRERLKAITRQIKPLVKMIREDEALNAAWKKAEQNARIAFREGRKEEAAKWKEKLKGILLDAREQREKQKIIKSLEKLSKKLPKNQSIALDFKEKIAVILDGYDFKKLTDAKKEQLEDFADFLEQDNNKEIPVFAEHAKTLRRLAQKSLVELSSTELNELNNTIKTLVELGREAMKITKYNNQAAYQERQGKLIESTKNMDSKRLSRLQQQQMTEEQRRKEIWKNGIKAAYIYTLHTFRVSEMFDGYKQGENTKLVKNLWRSELKYGKEHTEAIADFLEKRIAILGDRQLTTEEHAALHIHGRYLEGSYDAVQALLDTYNIALPDSVFAEAKFMTYEDINKYVPLSPQLRQYLELTQETVGKARVDRLAALYELKTNRKYDRVENYFLPLFYEFGDNIGTEYLIRQDYASVDDKGNAVIRTRHTKQGFNIKRKTGVTKTPRIDTESIIAEALMAQIWYLNMEPSIMETASLVFSTEYQKAAGFMITQWWRDYIDIVANKGWRSDANRNAMLSNIRGNLNSAVLLLKSSTILMQPFAVFDAMAYAQAKFGTVAAARIAAEFGKVWLNPKYAREIIEASEALKQRLGGELAIEEVLEELARKDTKWAKLKGIGAKAITWTDVRTAAGAKAGFEKILNDMGVENAGEEAEFLMNVTQGSANVTFRPLILGSGEGARTWFTFQTFYLNRWGVLAHNILMGNIVKGTYLKKMSGLIALGIMMLGSGAEDETRRVLRSLYGKKPLIERDTNIIADAVMYIPENMPTLGRALEQYRKTGRIERGANIPIAGAAITAVTGIADIIKGDIAKGTFKGAEAYLMLYRGMPGTAELFDLAETNDIIQKLRR